MKKLRRVRVSPALILSAIAVFLAAGGTTLASAPVSFVARSLGLSAKQKKQVRSIAEREIRRSARRLSVSFANSAGTAASATNAAHAAAATNATDATTAGSATNAANATNASLLGGVAASGYEGKVRWAFVSAAGSILSQSGGISVASHPGPGQYYLEWGSSVAGRALLSSVAEAGSFSGPIASSVCGRGAEEIVCGVGGGTSSETFTYTTSKDETKADRSFYIASIA